MKLIGLFISTILALAFASASSSALTFPDETQLKRAEAFLERIGNTNTLELELVLQRHIAQYEAATDAKKQANELEIILGYAVHIENIDQIIHFANLQLTLGEKLEDPIIRAMAKSNLAYSKSFKGEFQTAFKEITRLERETLESGNLKLTIHISMLKGLMSNTLGRTLESAELLKTIERDIIDNPKYDMQRMLLYWTIAFNAVSNDDLETTLKYYGLSTDLGQTNDWAIDSSSMIYNIAMLLLNEKAYSSAEKYLHKYGDVSIATGRESHVFYMHYGLTSLYMDQERYLDAVQEIESAQAFADIQVGFQPYLYIAQIKAYAHLKRVDQAKAAYEKFVQFFEDNPEYKQTRNNVNLLSAEAEILFAEGKITEAYNKFILFHENMVDQITSSHQVDAQGMRQSLEAAIAKEEAENKLAQSEVTNSYMLLGASSIIVIILLMFYSVQRKSSKDLKISKIEADSANQAKSKFLANVSHELRTPLNAIIGFSDIMQNDRIGPMDIDQTKEYSKLINDSGNHLLSIINDLLDINKIESGKMEMQEDAIDISWLLDDVNHLLQQTALQANIELFFDADNSLPDLLGDERHIKQILINLVNNSIKFSDAQTSIKTTAHLRKDKGITIKIQDEGIGMSIEDVKIAMEPFMRIQNTGKSEKEGTGLGLPLAKALTELHNGTMVVTSALGQGTLIELNFPIERAIATS